MCGQVERGYGAVQCTIGAPNLQQGAGRHEPQQRIAGCLTPPSAEIGPKPRDQDRRLGNSLAPAASGRVVRAHRRGGVTTCPNGYGDDASHAYAVLQGGGSSLTRGREAGVYLRLRTSDSGRREYTARSSRQGGGRDNPGARTCLPNDRL